MTVVEVLLASGLAIILFIAVTAMLGVASRAGQRTTDRSEAVLTARDGLDRLVKEARQAMPVPGQSPVVSANSFVFQRIIRGENPNAALASQTRQWVRWTCSGTTCTRSDSTTYPPPAGGATMIEDLQNLRDCPATPVFTLTASTLLLINVKVRVGETNPNASCADYDSNAPQPVGLHDGVFLRNLP